MKEADYDTVSPSGSDEHWRVPTNTTKQLILSASQDARAHASIFNNSTATLYLKFGNNVGMSVSGAVGIYDVKLTSASYYEMPKPIWQGEVWGVWDADVAGGFAMILSLGRSN